MMSIISDIFPLIECDLIFKPRCNIPWDVHTVYLNWNLLMPRHSRTIYLRFTACSQSRLKYISVINMRIRVAQADEALPFHRIPHDAPTSAICYIAVCSAEYTPMIFFCSEFLTLAPAKTHPERYRSTF